MKPVYSRLWKTNCEKMEWLLLFCDFAVDCYHFEGLYHY